MIPFLEDLTEFYPSLNSHASHSCDIKQFRSLYTKIGVISVIGSPIDVGGQYPFITFFSHLGLVVNFCYGVMKPVLYASRVWSWNPGCLSFVHCVDFEFLPFSHRSAAYVELAGIVPLGSSQGQDSHESCNNSRTNWGSLEKSGDGNPKFGALTITSESSGRDRIDKGDTGHHTHD